MFSALHHSRWLTASLTLCWVVFASHNQATLAQASTSLPAVSQHVSDEIPKAMTLDRSEILIAHHGTEGTSGAGVLGSATAAPVLSATIKEDVSKSVTSNSLWANMLLSMAYQRDSEIQRLIKKMGRVNNLTLLSIAGVSGLGLAQSIYALDQIKPQNIEVTDAHGPGGHDHVHIPEDSKVPSTMGIIGSGATLATLGMNAIMNKRYGSKLAKRQTVLKTQVEQIISRLKAGEATDQMQPQLVTLVGGEATEEFLSIWQATHPNNR